MGTFLGIKLGHAVMFGFGGRHAVNLCGGKGRVSKELRNRHNVNAFFKEPGCKGPAQIVEDEALYLRSFTSTFKALSDALIASSCVRVDEHMAFTIPRPV